MSVSLLAFLKGWWTPLEHESRCKLSLCIRVAEWDHRLKEAGFSGVDVEIPGQQDVECQYSSIMIASAIDASVSPNHPREIALVRDAEVEGQCVIAQSLQNLLLTQDIACTSYALEHLVEADIPGTTIIIFLIEVDAAFLAEISAPDYACLKAVNIRFKNTIWVTRPFFNEFEPRHHLADGFGRTLASGDSAGRFVTLELDSSRPDPGQAVSMIFKMISTIASSSIENLENNYVVKDGMLHTCRISKNDAMDKIVAQSTRSHCR